MEMEDDMAMTISDECIICDVCETVCPNDAISKKVAT